MAKTKLTVKQQRFVDYYDGNGSEAARKAGYSVRTANEQAARLLAKDSVKQAIANRERKTIAKGIASRLERQKFWTDAMHDENEKLQDRLRAAELLGKSEGDFLDKLQVSGSIEIKGLVFKPYKTRQDAPESTITPPEVSNTLDP